MNGTSFMVDGLTNLVRARLAIALAYAWNLQGQPEVARHLLSAARTFIRVAQNERTMKVAA